MHTVSSAARMSCWLASLLRAKFLNAAVRVAWFFLMWVGEYADSGNKANFHRNKMLLIWRIYKHNSNNNNNRCKHNNNSNNSIIPWTMMPDKEDNNNNHSMDSSRKLDLWIPIILIIEVKTCC